MRGTTGHDDRLMIGMTENSVNGFVGWLIPLALRWVIGGLGCGIDARRTIAADRFQIGLVSRRARPRRCPLRQAAGPWRQGIGHERTHRRTGCNQKTGRHEADHGGDTHDHLAGDASEGITASPLLTPPSPIECDSSNHTRPGLAVPFNIERSANMAPSQKNRSLPSTKVEKCELARLVAHQPIRTATASCR
jgi:hypothetical protein